MSYPRAADGRFDFTTYLARLAEPNTAALLEDREGRRILTRLDPLLFALTYVGHHLRAAETKDELTLSDAHIEWCKLAQRYVRPIGDLKPGALRDAIIAPRACGKSTWWYVLIPLWMAAHGHRQFIAAFASSATMAEQHLGAFKRELENNKLLRQDFPDLCHPAVKSNGNTEANHGAMYIAKSGFVFAARGIDSEVLGMKVGTKRPDHIILDDIEGSDGKYSPRMKETRLATVIAGVLPMNNVASVTIQGTVAMPGAIIDDIAAKQRGDEYPAWVDTERFVPRYYDVIQTDDDGTERSLWPERWSMDHINSMRHDRFWQSQMRNLPSAPDSPFWQGGDFLYRPNPATDTPPVPLSGQLLSIDPAVTTKEKSDFTALAVIGYSSVEKVCLVRDAWQVKLPPGKPLRERVLQILDTYPEIMGIVVETNQGGDTWTEAVLYDMPVRVHTVHNKEPKEVRAGSLLAKYQRGRVFHEKRLPQLEVQMAQFPHGAHDDLVDAVGTGVTVFLKDDKPKRDLTPRSQSYI